MLVGRDLALVLTLGAFDVLSSWLVGCRSWFAGVEVEVEVGSALSRSEAMFAPPASFLLGRRRFDVLLEVAVLDLVIPSLLLLRGCAGSRRVAWSLLRRVLWRTWRRWDCLEVVRLDCGIADVLVVLLGVVVVGAEVGVGLVNLVDMVVEIGGRRATRLDRGLRGAMVCLNTTPKYMLLMQPPSII